MQERINFTITDLNNYELTLEQFTKLFENVLLYYADKDADKFENFVNSFMIYFYLFHDLINKSKGEENGKIN